MHARQIELDDHQLQVIEDAVKTGGYRDENEVISAALAMFEEQAEDVHVRIERFKSLVQEGIDELDQGLGIRVNIEDLDQFLTKLGREDGEKE